MGKLRDLAGAIEDTVTEITDAVHDAVDEFIDVPFYVGDKHEILNLKVFDKSGNPAEVATYVLEKGDRINRLGIDGTDVLITLRHKLASGDTRKEKLLISAKEWRRIKTKLVLHWSNQAELAKLHKTQGHG
jgi:hypothetical protein